MWIRSFLRHQEQGDLSSPDAQSTHTAVETSQGLELDRFYPPVSLPSLLDLDDRDGVAGFVSHPVSHWGPSRDNADYASGRCALIKSAWALNYGYFGTPLGPW